MAISQHGLWAEASLTMTKKAYSTRTLQRGPKTDTSRGPTDVRWSSNGVGWGPADVRWGPADASGRSSASQMWRATPKPNEKVRLRGALPLRPDSPLHTEAQALWCNFTVCEAVLHASLGPKLPAGGWRRPVRCSERP